MNNLTTFVKTHKAIILAGLIVAVALVMIAAYMAYRLFIASITPVAPAPVPVPVGNLLPKVPHDQNPAPATPAAPTPTPNPQPVDTTPMSPRSVAATLPDGWQLNVKLDGD